MKSRDWTESAVLHNDKWSIATSMTSTTFFPLFYCIQFCSLPTSLLFTQMWPSSKQPLSGSPIFSLDLAKTQRDKNHLDKRKGCIRLWFSATPVRGPRSPTVPQSPWFVFNCALHQLGPKWKSQAGVWVSDKNYPCIRKQNLKVKQKGIGWRPMRWQEDNHSNSPIKTMRNIFFWHLKKHLWRSILLYTCEESQLVKGRKKETQPKQYDMVCL